MNKYIIIAERKKPARDRIGYNTRLFLPEIKEADDSRYFPIAWSFTDKEYVGGDQAMNFTIFQIEPQDDPDFKEF